MSGDDHAVRVFSSPDAPHRRRVELDGVEMRRVAKVTVEEAVNSFQEVTITFLTRDALVEPWGGPRVPATALPIRAVPASA